MAPKKSTTGAGINKTRKQPARTAKSNAEATKTLAANLTKGDEGRTAAATRTAAAAAEDTAAKKAAADKKAAAAAKAALAKGAADAKRAAATKKAANSRKAAANKRTAAARKVAAEAKKDAAAKTDASSNTVKLNVGERSANAEIDRLKLAKAKAEDRLARIRRGEDVSDDGDSSGSSSSSDDGSDRGAAGNAGPGPGPAPRNKRFLCPVAGCSSGAYGFAELKSHCKTVHKSKGMPASEKDVRVVDFVDWLNDSK